MNTAQFFDDYYKNAEVNSILIMDCSGNVLHANDSFTKNFGYNSDEIKGLNFNKLFIQRDKEKNKPQLELETVVSKGQAHDESYVVNKAGHAIWCIGESLLVTSQNGEKYIVKDIINLQAKKQLQLFLKETEDLLERVFESSKDIPIMILDGGMKIQKVNTAFIQLFEITDMPAIGSSLSELGHPFWNSTDIKNEVRKILVSNLSLKEKEFSFLTKKGETKTIRVNSKIIDRQPGLGRKIFILFEDVTVEHNQQL